MSSYSHNTVYQDLHRIADQLSDLASEIRNGGANTLDSAPNQVKRFQEKTNLELAKRTYADRRRRDRILGDAGLLGEPAWDILLDLYIAKCESDPVSVSSACVASACPPTTGLRWLGVLQEQGLVERLNDPLDQRRVIVRLTDEGVSRMDQYFEAVSNRHGARRPFQMLAEPDPVGDGLTVKTG